MFLFQSKPFVILRKVLESIHLFAYYFLHRFSPLLSLAKSRYFVKDIKTSYFPHPTIVVFFFINKCTEKSITVRFTLPSFPTPPHTHRTRLKKRKEENYHKLEGLFNSPNYKTSNFFLK